MLRSGLSACVSLVVLAGCAADTTPAHELTRHEAARATQAIARPALCDREGEDKVRDIFCASEPATTRNSIRNPAALEKNLGLNINPPTPQSKPYPFSYYPGSMNRVFVGMLSHSTSLSGGLVSELNPRVILMTDGMLLAFTRGEQQVEIVARDRVSHGFNFYLVDFEQACNTAADGCSTTDLFSERIESDWTSVELRDAEELKNTPFDCRQCHQRGHDKDEPVLLMRELNGPWTHFFNPVDDPPFPYPEPTGGNLMQDFLRAHGASLQRLVILTACLLR